MNEQAWSPNLVIVRLPPEPDTDDELDRVIQITVNGIGSDMILDFVDVLTVSQLSLCRLVVLHRLLDRSTQRLGFCNVSPAMRRVFKTHNMGRILEANCDEAICIKPSTNMLQDGSVVLGNQNRNATCERRRCARFNLSKSLRTTAVLWPRSPNPKRPEAVAAQKKKCTLVDVSQGGAQVVVDIRREPVFRSGQCLVLRFPPLACEIPINFDTLIRWVLPTADSEHTCLGLEFVGLEVNTRGRRSIQRLCDSEGRYFEALACGDDVNVLRRRF